MPTPLSGRAGRWPRRLLVLPLALAASCAGPALRAESPAAAALRARVTLDVISQWSPDVHFHDRERHFPISAEDLFKGATLSKVDPKNERPTGESRAVQSPSDLSGAGLAWRIRFDPNNPDVMRGNRDHDSVTAPMYVSVMVPADAAFVDIRYSFLFGFSGPQAMRSVAGSFNYTMGTLAEHDGGWEGFTVRLDPDLKAFVYGRTDARGKIHQYTRAQMDFLEGTHPQVRVAFNSHGVYNGKGRNPNDWIYLTNQRWARCIDIITRDGPVWQPWKASAGSRPFRLIGRDSSGRQLGESWANFRGRMGTARTSSTSGSAGIDGFSLPHHQMVMARVESLQVGAGLVDDEAYSALPTPGPGGRPEMDLELPAGFR